MSRSISPVVANALRGKRGPYSQSSKKAQGNRLCHTLYWLAEEASRRGVPFRQIYLEALTAGINKLGWNPPKRLNSAADPGE
jgi:hypothetical protein